jgi:hypothetical protein
MRHARAKTFQTVLRQGHLGSGNRKLRPWCFGRGRRCLQDRWTLANLLLPVRFAFRCNFGCRFGVANYVLVSGKALAGTERQPVHDERPRFPLVGVVFVIDLSPARGPFVGEMIFGGESNSRGDC